MKKLLKLLVVFVLCPTLVQATSLDGTSSIVYQNAHYVFRNFNTAKGYVRLNNGFTILAGQSAGLDTFVTVSGAIDLRTTGSLDLRSDLFLDQHVTWSSSGKIYGRGNTIHLGGSLSLPTDTIVQFIDDTIIDGHGHALTLGAHAQLLLASDVSLTLRNMTIQTTRNSSNIPIIRCFDQKGHVTLDNVELALADDFPFRTGRMFFNNDVIVTGTSRFVYQSVMQSYVAPHSLLTFDPGTALYYYPSSTDKDLIQLQDKSAGIYLKGSGTTLQTTHTGMRLTKGRLWLDNKVSLSTSQVTRLSSLTQTTSIISSINALVAGHDCSVWSPDGRFIVEAPQNTIGLPLKIFNFNNGLISFLASYKDPNPSHRFFSKAVWHPTGRFFAIGDVNPGFTVSVYSWDGSRVQLFSRVFTSLVRGVTWSPCGCYLATMTTEITTVNNVKVFRFHTSSGLSAMPIAQASFGDNDTSLSPVGKIVDWSPNGNYIVTAYLTTTLGVVKTQVYSFDGSVLSLQSSDSMSFGETVIATAVAWRPDGLFFLVNVNNSIIADRLLIYSFTGSTHNFVISAFPGGGVRYISANWSPNGRYIAVSTANTTSNIIVYEFTGSYFGLAASVIGSTGVSSMRHDVQWSPDSSQIASVFGDQAAPVNEVRVFNVNYTTESSTQALTNGLILGNSASGATFDLGTYFLSGATVNLAGQLMFDSTT